VTRLENGYWRHLFASRFLTAGLLGVAAFIAILVLWAELDPAVRWAECADAMQHSLLLCDAGPGNWAIGLTILVAVVLAGATGVAIERARCARRTASL